MFYNNINDILGVQIISRKNKTLVYKDGQFFLYSLECVKILKQLFASGSVILGEYSPRLRRMLVKYSIELQ